MRECAHLSVPLDYADPTGPTISVALARIPARGPGPRLGSILVDPGGPGISGVDEILTLPDQLSPQVEARYDVVGWDRRAVARSSPLWCRTPEQMGEYARALAGAQWSTAIDTPAVRAWADQAQAFADGCAQNNGDVIEHIGTRDSAQDMESIRVALGEPLLNYVGWSHGTKVGAIYIDRYPRRVGRMVLDSAIDPSLLEALRKAIAGDGSALIGMGGLRADPEPGDPSNRFIALYAINCFDSRPTPDLPGTARLAGQWDADTPIFGSPNAWGGLRCSHFPAHDPLGPQQVHGEGARPVVVVGAVNDGATPLEWSKALAEQLVSARLVVADTDAHSVYPFHNACVRRIVDAYLLDGTAPPQISDCPAG